MKEATQNSGNTSKKLNTRFFHHYAFNDCFTALNLLFAKLSLNSQISTQTRSNRWCNSGNLYLIRLHCRRTAFIYLRQSHLSSNVRSIKYVTRCTYTCYLWCVDVLYPKSIWFNRYHLDVKDWTLVDLSRNPSSHRSTSDSPVNPTFEITTDNLLFGVRSKCSHHLLLLEVIFFSKDMIFISLLMRIHLFSDRGGKMCVYFEKNVISAP